MQSGLFFKMATYIAGYRFIFKWYAYLKWDFSDCCMSILLIPAVVPSRVSSGLDPYRLLGFLEESISSVTSWPRPHSEDPHCFSTKTRSTKWPSSPCLKVQGMMQKRPSGSRILLLTSLRFTNVSVLSIYSENKISKY